MQSFTVWIVGTGGEKVNAFVGFGWLFTGKQFSSVSTFYSAGEDYSRS